MDNDFLCRLRRAALSAATRCTFPARRCGPIRRWGLFLTVLLNFQAEAAVVNFIIEDRGLVVDQTAQITAQNIFIKASGGDPQRDLLFDVQAQTLFLIEHRDQSYLQIDNQTIDEVAALVDSISGVVESQQGVLSDLLSTFGVSGESPQPAAKLIDSGRELSIGGYPCQLHQAHQDGKLNFELCIADNQALNLPAHEFTALREFFLFSNRLQSKAGKLLSVLGLELPKMDLEDKRGLPIGMHSPAQQLKVRVSDIDSTAAPPAITLPTGYTRSELPLISS